MLDVDGWLESFRHSHSIQRYFSPVIYYLNVLDEVFSSRKQETTSFMLNSAIKAFSVQPSIINDR